MMEETKGLGQRALKLSTRDCFLLNSWFLSKKEAEASTSIGVDLIGMAKINTKTKDQPGGFYIVLRSKPMVTGERRLLAIGYN